MIKLEELKAAKERLRPIVYSIARRSLQGFTQTQISRHLYITAEVVEASLREAESVLRRRLPRHLKKGGSPTGGSDSPAALERLFARADIKEQLPDKEGVKLERCTVCTLILPHETCIPSATFFASHRRDDAA